VHYGDIRVYVYELPWQVRSHPSVFRGVQCNRYQDMACLC
jgi:hypothetical protein